LAYRGTAVLDIISPCVTFNNRDESTKSYAWGRAHEDPLHDVTYVRKRDEIMVEYEPGQAVEVPLHDGSTLMLKKLAQEYDPCNRVEALQLLEQARASQQLLTGLIYYNPDQPSLQEVEDLIDIPLSQLPDEALRPAKKTLQEVMVEFS
jgi:2-oxoglutarate ferredoxin oxidoreductase subunit beta